MYLSPLVTHPPVDRFSPFVIPIQEENAGATLIEGLFDERAFIVIVCPPLLVHDSVSHVAGVPPGSITPDVKVPEELYIGASYSYPTPAGDPYWF